MSNYKELPSQQYLQECFDYDELTGNLTWKERQASHFKNDAALNYFNSKFAGKLAGSNNTGGYVLITISDVSYSAHRLIWKMIVGVEPVHLIDHINKIRNDNRIQNLRNASDSENQHNSTMASNNTSGFIGVHFDKGANKWAAKITIRGNKVRLGNYDNKEDAILARKNAEKADWSHLETKEYIIGKECILTIEFLKECFTYNYDGSLSWKNRPSYHFNTESGCKIFNSRYANTNAGYIHSSGYFRLSLATKQRQLHHIVYMLHNDVTIDEIKEIDHIDGNPLNNRIENLRLVNSSQNGANKKIYSSNSSGAVGVTYNKRSCKWIASISFGKTRTQLGSFINKDDAIKARLEAEEIHHGEFSRK